MANGAMNGVLKRRLLFVVGPFTGLVMFASVVMIATFLGIAVASAVSPAPVQRESGSAFGKPPSLSGSQNLLEINFESSRGMHSR